MNENEEFKAISLEAMNKLGVGKTIFAQEHLEIDPKSLTKYWTKGAVPRRVWLRAIALATDEPEHNLNKALDNSLPSIFRSIYEKFKQ